MEGHGSGYLIGSLESSSVLSLCVFLHSVSLSVKYNSSSLPLEFMYNGKSSSVGDREAHSGDSAPVGSPVFPGAIANGDSDLAQG